MDSITRKAVMVCDIISNSSASNYVTDKIYRRIFQIKKRLADSCATYLYTNNLGCEGNRLYYDGGNFAMSNGVVQYLAPFASLEEVNVMPVTVNISKQRTKAMAEINFMREASLNKLRFPIIDIDGFNITEDVLVPTKFDALEVPRTVTICCSSQQMLNTMSSYLWDYVRKNRAAGCFLPSSGGIDSAITAMIVYYLSDRLLESIQGGSEFVLSELRAVLRDPTFMPEKASDICSKLLFTSYLSTKHSSQASRLRA